VAGISTEIILVTEADIVTLNGNINLYSYLSNVYKENSDVLRNVRFVINRVPKGQDINLIEQRYMKRLYDLFKTRPILASIPFDNTIFQSFGQHWFVVDTIPNSVFSRHVAGIASGLFSRNHQELLSDRVRKMASTLDEPWFVSGRKAIFGAFGSLMKTRR
jgi:MinD-like ATPase involved in chromosome partitioning or flagellar assembly